MKGLSFCLTGLYNSSHRTTRHIATSTDLWNATVIVIINIVIVLSGFVSQAKTCYITESDEGYLS